MITELDMLLKIVREYVEHGECKCEPLLTCWKCCLEFNLDQFNAFHDEAVGALVQARNLILEHHTTTVMKAKINDGCPVCENDQGKCPELQHIYDVLKKAGK